MKSSFRDQSLLALGIAPRDFEVLATLSARDVIAHAGRRGPFDGLPTWKVASNGIQLIEQRLPALMRRAAGLFASAEKSGLYAIESFAPALRTLGSVEVLERGRWCLDSTRGPAAIAFDSFVALADGPELWIGCLRIRDSRSASPGPPGPPDQGRELDALFGKRPAEDWLIGYGRALFSERNRYSQVVAVGLLGRLWSPPSSSSGRVSPPRGSALDYFEEAIEGQSPSAAARGWYQQLDKGIQCAAEDEACDLADDLRPALHELTALASLPDGERLPRAALRWVTVRDDLESFAFLLGRQRRGTKLQGSLERLDREAANHLSIFSGLDLCKDPRLRTVSWQEPDQWWGRLAAPK